MGHKRFVTSDMSSDERLAGIAQRDPLAAALWPWFLTALDDWGRAKFAPAEIKLSMFPGYPFDAAYVEDLLGVYAQAGLIKIYEVEGKRYWCVPLDKWLRYQSYISEASLAKRKPKCPPPPDMEEDFLEKLQTSQKNLEELQTTEENVLSLSLSPSLTSPPSGEQPDANASGQKPAAKSKKKRPKPAYDEDTKALVTELAEWRIEQNAPPTERDWHLKQLAIVQKLRDKGGCTPDQLRACLHDAQNDEYWRAQLDSWATVERYLPKWKLKQARADPANGSRNEDPYLEEIVKEARARRAKAKKAMEADTNDQELTQQSIG